MRGQLNVKFKCIFRLHTVRPFVWPADGTPFARGKLAICIYWINNQLLIFHIQEERTVREAACHLLMASSEAVKLDSKGKHTNCDCTSAERWLVTWLCKNTCAMVLLAVQLQAWFLSQVQLDSQNQFKSIFSDFAVLMKPGFTLVVTTVRKTTQFGRLQISILSLEYCYVP